MNAKPVVIKKYENRRLYDTSASRYINLDDIAQMVRNGKEVRVVDAKTSEDLTRVVLAQIIMEDTKDESVGLPLELLRQLIVATDHVGRDFVMWYLKSAFDAYDKMQGAFQGGLSGIRSAAAAPLDMMREFIQASPAPSKATRVRSKRQPRRGRKSS